MEQTFGKYRLIENIGKGGMAEVYLATQIGDLAGFEKQVALKMMSQNLSDREDLVIMFLDEARIAAQLNHPNIVHVYDLGRVDDTLYIAMEYVEGKDLRRICEQGIEQDNFLSREFAARIIADAAAGLHYAHTSTDKQGQPRNIVHRDVTPQNILVSMDGQIKVADFGVAKAEDRLGHTRVGQRKGKLSYMSPEQFEASKVDARSDVYALGILLYETTVETRLFRGRSDFETMSLIANSVVTPPHELRPDYPPELEAIVMRALAKEVDARYQSALELQNALEGWLHAQEDRVGPVELSNYMHVLFPPQPKAPAPEPAAPGEPTSRVMDPGSARTAPQGAAPQPAPRAAQSTGQPGQHPSQRPASAAPAPAAPAPEQVAAASPSTATAEVEGDTLQADGGWEDDLIFEGYSNAGFYAKIILGLLVAAGVIGLVGYSLTNSKSGIDTEKSDAIKEARARAAQQVDEPILAPDFVDVTLETDPPGARVVVNGLAADSVTPGEFKLVDGEENEVVFYHPEYPPMRVSMNGASGAPQGATALLEYPEKPANGTLEIQSDPPGGIVYVDGERLGEAPQIIEDISAGYEHHVQVRMSGHWDFAGIFEVAPEQRNAFRVSLASKESKSYRDTVEVTYDIIPKYSDIRVNGELRGRSLLQVNEPRNQLLRVELSKKHSEPRERTILTHEIGTFTLRTFLDATERAEGTLKISTSPKGSIVYVNSSSHRTNPLQIKLPEDSYDVVVETPDGTRYDTRVDVDADTVNSYKIDVEDGALQIESAK